jgi:hypothetical protein
VQVPEECPWRPARPAPLPARFYGLLALAVVGLSAGYAALVLYSASWPEAAALRDFYDWQPRAYTAGEFAGLRLGLAGLASVALGLAAGLGLAPAGRAQGRALAQEVRSGWRGLSAGWRALSPRQRRGAWGGLLALTALRTYYSLVMAPADDGVSYEVFVRARLLVVSAAYPFPNNHVLSNTLAWVFYQLHPGFWWSMRLPVLLTATGATGLWFVALLRRSSFRAALLAVSLFSVLQLSFYHAVTGRGYWLLVGLAAVGFFAVLELSGAAAPVAAGLAQAPRRARAAWAGLVVSGVLGLYTVPTHAYFLLSAYGWLGLSQLRRRAWPEVGVTSGLGLLTLLGAGLLYAPLLLLSGPRLLFHNDYVRSLAPGDFWRSLPAYLWLNEGWLSGHRWVGGLPLLAVLLGLGYRWHRRASTGPTGPVLAVRRLAGPCLWFMAAPYLLVLGQRVQPPERTLFYKSMLLCVLAALLADWALARLPAGAGRRRAQGLLGAAGVAVAASQVALLARHNEQQVRQWLIYRQPMAWLATQPVGPVLAPVPDHRFVLRFFAHTEFRGQGWQIDDHPRPGVHYRYLVGQPGAQAVPGGPAVVGPPAFHGLADIFVAP